MKTERKLLAGAAMMAATLLCFGTHTALAQAPAGQPATTPGSPASGADAAAPPRRGGGSFAADPRAQVRSYHLADANQDMQYCVYASSKVSPAKAAPLIVSLHGMGAPPTIMCNTTAVDLAEEGGYVLVAPMGYSTTGWYGSPVINLGAARAPGARPADAAAPAAAGPTNAQIEKWSEQDVMNVLGMMREEFTIDPKRIYLTGHSMGGAGTLFLGAKHANLWAAIAAVAPASFMMNNDRAQILGKLKAAGVPVLLLTGDADEVVAPANTRLWAETLKELKVDHVYIEQPGITHGPVITSSQKEIYGFFAKHVRK